jgi:LPXTG-site transpeptidase (sortase) family protein
MTPPNQPIAQITELAFQVDRKILTSPDEDHYRLDLLAHEKIWPTHLKQGPIWFMNLAQTIFSQTLSKISSQFELHLSSFKKPLSIAQLESKITRHEEEEATKKIQLANLEVKRQKGIQVRNEKYASLRARATRKGANALFKEIEKRARAIERASYKRTKATSLARRVLLKVYKAHALKLQRIQERNERALEQRALSSKKAVLQIQRVYKANALKLQRIQERNERALEQRALSSKKAALQIQKVYKAHAQKLARIKARNLSYAHKRSQASHRAAKAFLQEQAKRAALQRAKEKAEAAQLLKEARAFEKAQAKEMEHLSKLERQVKLALGRAHRKKLLKEKRELQKQAFIEKSISFKKESERNWDHFKKQSAQNFKVFVKTPIKALRKEIQSWPSRFVRQMKLSHAFLKKNAQARKASTLKFYATQKRKALDLKKLLQHKFLSALKFSYKSLIKFYQTTHNFVLKNYRSALKLVRNFILKTYRTSVKLVRNFILKTYSSSQKFVRKSYRYALELARKTWHLIIKVAHFIQRKAKQFKRAFIRFLRASYSAFMGLPWLQIRRFALTSFGIYLSLFTITNAPSYAKGVMADVTAAQDARLSLIEVQHLEQLSTDPWTGELIQVTSLLAEGTLETIQPLLENANNLALLPIDLTPINYDNRIVIPSINVNAPIVQPKLALEDLQDQNWNALEDKIRSSLLNGVVHYPGTAVPGQKGNIFLTAHSSNVFWDTSEFNSVFALVPRMEEGDDIFIYYNQEEYHYRVSFKEEVKPTNVGILAQDENKLSLVTCTPVGTTLNRTVITAYEVEQ